MFQWAEIRTAHLEAHFIKGEKPLELQMAMNWGTRVNGLAAWSGPRRNQIGRSVIR